MKRIITAIIVAHILAAPCCLTQAGTLSVECDAVPYTTPLQYKFEAVGAFVYSNDTKAEVPVPDCSLATVRVMAIAGTLQSEWSAPFTAWPDIEVTTLAPDSVNLATGEVVITITGNNFPPEVDVTAGVKGEPSWESTFTETEKTCTSVTGTLRIGTNVTSGMDVPLTLVSSDQVVLAGTVVVTVEILPAPTGLRVNR